MSVTKRQILAGGASLFAVSLLGLRGAGAAEAPLKIVATTGMIADALSQVGGARVQVQGLMGAGVDPHSYRQTRSDIATMLRADAVVWHGLYLEAQLEEFLTALAAQKPVFALAQGVAPGRLIASPDYPDRFDPHVWMDPTLWLEVIAAAQAALTEIEPASAEIFAQNAARHRDEIAKLAAYSTEALSSVPQSARVLVTAHDAFSYFGQAYGFEVLGVQGISTESEAGIAQIEALVSLLVERKISAIFVESSVSDRNVKALIEGAAAKGHKVAIGGELFSDAMGPAASYEGSYLGMIDHNVTTITRALGGTAPERGMNGKLSS